MLGIIYKLKKLLKKKLKEKLLCRGAVVQAVVITTAQLHSTKPEIIRFCADSNLAGRVLQIRDGEDL